MNALMKRSHDPSRHALEQAHRQVAEAESALNKAVSAESRAVEFLSAAESRHHEAESALAVVRRDYSLSLSEAVTGGNAPSSDNFSEAKRAARAALDDAADEVGAARELLTKLATEREDAEERLHQAHYSVTEATVDVIKHAATDLITEAIELQDRLVRARLELRWLMRERLIANNDWHRLDDLLGDWQLPTDRGGGDFANGLKWDALDAPRRWRDWRDNLEADASAQLTI